MERRQHGRVRLHLPARIRWITPFGQQAEVHESEDVSRGGLRLTLSSPVVPGTHLWVTFPYDASLPHGQPEMPARVVRSEPRALGLTALAVHLASPAPRTGGPHAEERRASPRRAVAIPVRVRPDNFPWFEEAMTLDVSAGGLRFRSTREYQPGTHLFLSFGAAAAAPFPGGRFLIVRVEAQRESSAVAVSVCRIAPASSFDDPPGLR